MRNVLRSSQTLTGPHGQHFVWRWRDRVDRTDEALFKFIAGLGIHLPRWTIALVCLWFGGPNPINANPAGESVARTVF